MPTMTEPNGDFGAQYIAYSTPANNTTEVRPVIGWGPSGEGWPHLTPVIAGDSGPVALQFNPARRYTYGPTREDAARNLNKQLGGKA